MLTTMTFRSRVAAAACAISFSAHAIAIADPGAGQSAGAQDSKSEGQLQLAQADQGLSTPSSGSEGTTRVAQNAQNTGSDTKGSAPSARLEEVLVTAQRRVENLQDVPVSVQVISGETLIQQNQNSLFDLALTVPSLYIGSGDKGNFLTMRGIGADQGNNVGFEQAVALFADDIYRGRSRMSDSTFLDLDRVEILKGPQSTFFGNNAIAGALNIISKKPGDTFDGYARLLAGNFEQYALEGAVGGPITDTLRARVALSANGNERGWLYDLSTGNHEPRIHNLSGRATFVYQPIDTLDATLKLEASRHKTLGTDTHEPNQWSVCPYPPYGTSWGLFLGCDTAMTLGVPFGYENNDLKLLPGEQNRLTNYDGALTVNYHQWNHTFTSVTGYSYYDFFTDVNATYVPMPYVQAEWLEHFHQFSQELRVASSTGQPIEYLVGAYFQSDRLGYDQVTTSSVLTPLLQGDPVVGPYLPVVTRQGIAQSEDIYSIFGSLTWNATDRLKLSAGFRGSRVDKDYNAHVVEGTSARLYGGFVETPASVQQYVNALFGVPSLGTSPRLTLSSHAPMPSARIEYKLDPDVMAYFRYDRGFLAGGFNGADVYDFGNIAKFGPEYVNAYELGLKSKWLEKRLLLNIDIFLSDYSDLQVASNIYTCAPNGGLCTYDTSLGNAAKARSQGVEFEGQWLPTSNFRLGTNVTYLKAYYSDYPNSPLTTLQGYCKYVASGSALCLERFPTGVPSVYDATGNPMGYAPKWSGSLTAAYDVSLPGQLRLTTELSSYFTSAYNKDPDGIVAPLGNYVRLDGRLALGPQGGRWSLDLIGKNLTDRTIITTLSTLYTFQKEPPRSVALQFSYRFGR